MKIVIYIPSIYGGTGLYRLKIPHDLISSLGHEVKYTDSTEYEDLVGDIFICSKMYFIPILKHLDRMRKDGIVTIIDYDDYWVLPQDHLLYWEYKKHNTSKILSDALKSFDNVICTTELLADEIRKINPNVVVFENAVNTELPQFGIDDIQSDDIRFGWIGGHCHLTDIELLSGTPGRLVGFENFTINLFGHDQRQNSIYDKFADILSGNKSIGNRMRLFRQANVNQYTKFYNLIDVCLIPLRDSKFNSMKSELKLVEGAFFRKACIVSNVMPYKPYLTPQNSLICDNRTDWYKNMRKLIKNPSMCADLGGQLYEDIHERFDIKTVNKRRLSFYESIIGG